MTLAVPGDSAQEANRPVRVGLEQLGGSPGSLAGKRLGLVVHSASMTVDGRHAVDVVRGHGFEVVRLFTPEHGLRGRAAAGEVVADGRDSSSGLPIVSLYGEHKKPRGQDLTDLDALVFDLQGAGVRFYTYVSTMILCLEAAGEAGIEFIVLDRPNPLGGERIEGPVAAPREIVPSSFVNLAPGPLIHGLTMGEMAQLVNAKLPKPAELSVVEMRGWSRSMTWADTGRPWVAPSPNLLSVEAALAYPGVALMEATNVSEGRGTELPFLRLGAPWLEIDRFLASWSKAPVQGFAMKPTRFVPTGSPAAPHPKFRGEECSGVVIEVTDPSVAEPYRLGLTLLHAMKGQTGFEWLREGLTWLLGTPKVYRALRGGRSVDEILAEDAADHIAWRQQRRAFLLY